MIKVEMKKFGISTDVEEVFEVEVCEFENEDFSCLDSVETLLITDDEDEAWEYCESKARDRMNQLNKARGGLQEDGEFYGLRLTRYLLQENGEYENVEGDDYFGEFEIV